MEAVLAAVVTQLGGLILLSLKMRSDRRKAERERKAVAKAVAEVHDEVRTNHGKRAGEYLELVPMILANQELHEQRDARRFARLGITDD